jgi:hypothetical protein
MPYNLLLLPLLGGFLFFHIAHYFRFSAQRLDGYRLLLQTAVAGTLLEILARFLGLLFELLPISESVQNRWNALVPFPYAATSLLAFVLGPLAAIVWNIFVTKEEAKEIEIRKHGNAFTQLLLRAQKEKQLISITLENRKWYIGWITESPNLDPQELYFRLLPYRSGYRETDNLKTVYTTYYEGALGESSLRKEDLIITLPLKDVKAANLFDEDLYNDYFAEPIEPSDDPEPSHRHHREDIG